MFKISRHEIVNELFEASENKIMFAISYWMALPIMKIRMIFMMRKLKNRFGEDVIDDLDAEEYGELLRTAWCEEMGFNPEQTEAFNYCVDRIIEE